MKEWSPRGYQPPVIEHILSTPRCAVWAGMGLGKTVATLTALDALFLAGEDRPALVLAPLRVARSTWPDEARKWKHLRHISVSAVIGTEEERRRALRLDAAVYATNYEQLPWLVEYFGKSWPFKTVVADESTKLKSFRIGGAKPKKNGEPRRSAYGSQRATALARLTHTHITRFIELTGTPAPNGLKDLWGQMWFVDAGQRLGRTYDAFRQRWFQQSFDGHGLTPLPHAQGEIQNLLRDVCITIDPADWFDLKAPIVHDMMIELPGKARKAYREMERQMFTEIAGMGVEAVNAAARTAKCLQLAAGNVWTDAQSDAWEPVHDEKLNALEEIVEEAGGAPLLVAYQWVPSLRRILKRFPEARQLDQDPRTIDDWNAGRIPMLVAHPQSCGHGLNLQDGGNTLVYFDHWWNLEERQQILERIGPVRQLQAGHDRPVYVHNILAHDTIDELVLERVQTKREVQDILLDAMKRRGA